MSEAERCPRCGSSKVDKIGCTRAAAISLDGDRKCGDCGTVWAPPMPRWAGAVFLFFSAILLAGDLAYLGYALATARIGFAFVCGAGLAFLFAGGVYGGLRVIAGKAKKPEILREPTEHTP